MQNSKIKLREIFIKKRKSVRERTKKEIKISDKLSKLFLNNFLTISVYYAVKSEVDISFFIKLMQKNDHKVVLPVIIKTDSHLLFKAYNKFGKLRIDKFGIKIPEKTDFLIPKILLIPMLAFDKNKNRLGYGGGFYDRTIEYLEKNNNILKIGVAFDEQESKNIPTKYFDKRMDAIITQSRVII